MSVTLESVVVQDPELVQTGLADYTMLMSIEAGKFYSINPSGSRIWQLIQTPTCVREVCETLLAEYEVSPEQCHANVLALIEALLDQRLVQLQTG